MCKRCGLSRMGLGAKARKHAVHTCSLHQSSDLQDNLLLTCICCRVAAYAGMGRRQSKAASHCGDIQIAVSTAKLCAAANWYGACRGWGLVFGL